MFYQIPCSPLWKCSLAIKLLHSSRHPLLNHYDTLKVSRNCTAKDIKNSYIKLSKEHHPDVNKKDGAHKQFLKITEAYNVLSKPHLRRSYDQKLDYRETQRHKPKYTTDEFKDFNNQQFWGDSTFYTNRDKSKDAFYSSKPYYGIHGVNRVSNSSIAIVCLLFTAVIVTLQILTIRHSFTLNHEELNRKSDAAKESLSQIKSTAVNNGNKRQLELLRDKLMTKDE